jgi:copper chaperone
MAVSVTTRRFLMKVKELTIEGMHCGHCVMAVKKELSKLANVIVDDVQIGSARLRVEEANVTTEQLMRAVEEAGYRLTSIH